MQKAEIANFKRLEKERKDEEDKIKKYEIANRKRLEIEKKDETAKI